MAEVLDRISAKCEEQGGIDLLVIYNSGRYRMAGRGSLSGLMPYGNANQIVREMGYEVLTAVKHTPVLAGVCGTDPFMLRDQFLHELNGMGFAGIQNFPTVGLIDGLSVPIWKKQEWDFARKSIGGCSPFHGSFDDPLCVQYR